MNAIKLCEAELEALQELVLDGYPFAQVLYVLQFRTRMSFDSFTVGDRSNNTVKESWLGDCIERRAKQGSRFSSKRRSRQFIQRQIAKLVEYGLLQRLEKKHQRSPMCFFFPLAARGLNRILEERTMSEHKTSDNKLLFDEDIENPVNSTADIVRTSVDNFESSDNEKQAKSEHIPVNRNLYPNNNVYNAREDEEKVLRGDGYLIPKDWMPSEHVESEVKKRTFCSDLEFEWHVQSFRIYWLERGESRSDWNHVFLWFTRNHGLTR